MIILQSRFNPPLRTIHGTIASHNQERALQAFNIYKSLAAAPCEARARTPEWKFILYSSGTGGLITSNMRYSKLVGGCSSSLLSATAFPALRLNLTLLRRLRRGKWNGSLGTYPLHFERATASFLPCRATGSDATGPSIGTQNRGPLTPGRH
ncbi:hypothetical protein FA13DRAFT_1037815 [Coprinellus micaceus]|uniref:Uncharacterized protein n=1 Tax=Coprinellus micaceus TaxID=71717 RepID=A0A4Y7SXU0_COPMI|nr:hypothetical protein FA13DRAFT_1037815 [Coprinellus micaceus]